MGRTRLTAFALAVCLSLAACSATAGDAADAMPSPDANAAEQVAFDSGDLTLQGDLYLHEGTGPSPGVVLIHGSGPLDRDETVPGQLNMMFPEPVTVFADLANALRAAGYSVLTYDKRTCGTFNDCAENGYPPPASDLTIDDFVADATAAVGYLRQRAEVRPDAIAVAGHSQGASFVPGMLDDDPNLAAGAMLAPPFDPIDDVAAAQDSRLAEVSTLRSEDVDDTAMIAGASAQFWRSWITLTDETPTLAAEVEQPLLVLGGSLDTNVPPNQIQQWRQALMGQDAQVLLLDCVTHALNCLTNDDMRTIVPADVGTTVAPDVEAAVVDFLDAAVR